MNVIVIEALISIVLAFAVGGVGYLTGRHDGRNEQKASDQAQFDKINMERSKQQQDASIILTKIQQGITDQVSADAKKSHKLEQQANDLLDENLGLRASLASRSLRFVSTVAAKGGTNRTCGPSAASSPSSSASAVEATVVQLPEPLAGNLRQFALDAQRLNIEYGKCYGWVSEGKAINAP